MAKRLNEITNHFQSLGGGQKLLRKKAFDLHVGSRAEDTFLLDSSGPDSGYHRLVNFKTGPGGDVLDLTQMLDGATAETLGDFIKIKFTRGGATLFIDADGDGSGYTDAKIKLHGIKLKSIDDLLGLIDDGNLIVSNIVNAKWQAGDGSGTYTGGPGTEDTFTLGIVPTGTGVVITPTSDGKVQIALSTGEIIILDDFEELVIEGSDYGDHITILGDFSGTDIAQSTFTYSPEGAHVGTSGDDYFDASGLSSDHRVVVHGRAGNDILIGGIYDDVLFGGADDDILRGGPGDDNVTGGTGYDILEVAGSYADYVITGDLSAASLTGGPDGDDTLAGIEAIHFDEGPIAVWYLDGTPNTGLPPSVTGFSASVDENAGALALGTVTASDPEGGSVQFSIKSGPGSSLFSIDGASGVLSAVGSFDFEGGGPGYSLTVIGTDPDGLTGEATVTVTINDVNEAPISTDDTGATDADATTTIDVSANDDDVDNDDDESTLTYSLVAAPAKGAVTNNADGTFTFDPGTDFDGLADGQTEDVTFTYKATDGHGADGNVATVTVTVTGVASQANQAPIVESGRTITVGVGSGPIDLHIAEPTDPDGDPLTIVLLSLPANGTLTHADGSSVSGGGLTLDELMGLRFEPAAGSEGTQSYFNYHVFDSHGATTKVSVATNVMAAPSAGSGFLMTGYTPQDGFGIYHYDNGVMTLLQSDIDGRQVDHSLSSYSTFQELIQFKGATYFSLQRDIATDELWKLEGGVFSQVSFGDPNYGSLAPDTFVVHGDLLYFLGATSKSDGSKPTRLYWTDGTNFGEVTDGTSGTWEAEDILVLNGKVYVPQEYGNWWLVDGKSMTNTGHYANTYESGAVVIDGAIYYDGNYDLYRYDGTTTTRVNQVNRGDFDPSDIHQFGSLIMLYGDEPVNDKKSLYYSDGVQVWKMAEGAVKGGEMGGYYWFAMKPPTDGSELWFFDGTFWVQAHTAPFTDSQGNINAVLSLGDEILVSWKPSGKAAELWSYDGTTYKELNVPIEFFGAMEAFVSGDQVIIKGARDGYGTHPFFTYDGTNVTTLLANEQATGDGIRNDMVGYGSDLYFNATDGTFSDFYNFDGTTLSVETGGIANINISQPTQVLDGILYYFSEDYAGNRAQRGTWSWDGTTAQFLSADYAMRPERLQIFDGQLRSTDDGILFNNSLVKIVSDTTYGYRLRIEDTGGNFTYHDFFADTTGKDRIYNTFVEANGLLYFLAEDQVNGRELWVYDGLNTPTLVSDFHSGTDGFYGIISHASYEGALYFLGSFNAGDDHALFKATPNGMTLISDADNIGGYFPAIAQGAIMVYRDDLYFAADDANGVRQLYVLVNDVPTPVPGLSDLDLAFGFVYGGNLMLWGENRELYSFDGTDITLVHNFLGEINASDISVVEAGGKLYFAAAAVDPATDVFVGRELFVWDGATFELVTDINSNSADVNYGGRSFVLPLGGDDATQIIGGSGNDVLVSTAESNVMTGGDGADRYVFIASDRGENVITDFDPDLDGDVADLVPLFAPLGLGAGDETGAVLDSYMDFTFDGQNTLLEIDLDLDGTPELSILFEGIDLVDGEDDASVIDGGLASGGLDVL